MSAATVTTAHVRDVPALRVFARTCAAEWTRLRTVRTTWAFLGAACLLMVGIGTVAGNEADPASAAGDPAWVASAVTSMPGQFAFLALALTAVTADYGTGGIVPTLQWTPRRTVLLVARLLVTVGTTTAALPLTA